MVPDADPSAETHEMSFLDPNSDVYTTRVSSGDHEILIPSLIHKLKESMTPAPLEMIVARPLPSGFMTPICVLNSH
jgi:hypothetical protein